MRAALINWIDDRTGVRRFMREALYENIPGGARWRYVTGSMLVFAFTTQAITGIFLWMFYSPANQTAYESVFWIENVVQGGSLLRGIHHFMAQAMVALLPIHLFQVIWDKAYRAPREFNFWTGMFLMLITLGLSLTGYLLPWDQKGYWATKVATNLMALGPGGEHVQKLVVGGNEYGSYTLTRFFSLHTGILPALLVLFLVLHIALFRRHGITGVGIGKRPDQYFWPYQVLKDGVACLLLLFIVLGLYSYFGGAHLSSPADQVHDYKAARPEWYFLFLFQFLKFFGEGQEILGAIVVPSLLLLYFFLMPLIGRWTIGHYLNVVVLLAVIGGAITLTALALNEDYYARFHGKVAKQYKEGDPALQQHKDRYKASHDYLVAVKDDKRKYHRLQELIDVLGIPPQGVSALMQRDPEIQGAILFSEKCANCHSYLDKNGEGIEGPEVGEGAPNLYKFASRAWLSGLLNPKRIVSDDYFGRTKHAAKEDGAYPTGGMVEFVHENLSDLDDEKKKALQDLIAAVSAEAKLPSQSKLDADTAAIDRGREAFTTTFACTDCHKLHDDGDLGMAPDLTGYGSFEWLVMMISNPEHERFYKDRNDRMPAFGESKELSQEKIAYLAHWLRGDAVDVMQFYNSRSTTEAREQAEAKAEAKASE